MKKGPIIFIAAAIMVISCASWSVITYNGFIRQEHALEAISDDMKSAHAFVYKQMEQQGVVVSQYGDMVIEAIEAAIEGRYGQTGSQAAWSWIQEQNPGIDPAVMEKLQTAIEAGYNKLAAVQTEKIDRVRAYKNSLEVFPSNVIASFGGFPRIDLEKVGQIITSAQTKRDFESGELSSPNIFNE